MKNTINQCVRVFVCVCFGVCSGGLPMNTYARFFIDAAFVSPLLIFSLVFLFDNIVLWNQLFACLQFCIGREGGDVALF